MERKKIPPPPKIKTSSWSPDWKQDLDFELPISPRKVSSPNKARVDWEQINRTVLSLLTDKELEARVAQKWAPALPWKNKCPCCGSKKVEPVFPKMAWSTLRCDLKHMWWAWGGDPVTSVDQASSSFRDCIGPDNFQAYHEIKAEVLLEALRKGVNIIQHASNSS